MIIDDGLGARTAVLETSKGAMKEEYWCLRRRSVPPAGGVSGQAIATATGCGIAFGGAPRVDRKATLPWFDTTSLKALVGGSG